MAFLLNGTSPKAIKYIGNDVQIVVCNGVEIWRARHKMTLRYAYASSDVRIYKTSTDSSSAGSLNQETRFYLISQTEENGRLPVIYNRTIYWINKNYVKVHHTVSVYNTDTVAIYNSHGGKDIYSSRSHDSNILKHVYEYPIFVLLEDSPVDDFWYVRHNETVGYVGETNYLINKIDLSSYDLSKWWED